MDALTVALGAGIGVVVVAIIGVLVMLTRRGRTASDELWAPTPREEPALAPYWEHELPDVIRPMPPSHAKVALDPAARAALITWQDAEGELLDRWLSRHEARLARIAEASDRTATYMAVLKEMSAAEERLVHEAIARTPDAELRGHLESMHKAAIDALIEATKGEVAASSHAYASYVRHRTQSEARMEALEPATPSAPAPAPAAAPAANATPRTPMASAAAAVEAARPAPPTGKPLDPSSAPPAPTLAPATASDVDALPTRAPRTGPSTDEQPSVGPAT